MAEYRNTIQKTLILNAIKTLAHPTAEEIYNAVAKEHAAISRGTVYRNLKSMTDLGLIRQVRSFGGADHYDHTVHSHYHCRCIKCKKVFDVDLPYMEELNGKTSAVDGFVAEDHDIVFTGVCPQCK